MALAELDSPNIIAITGGRDYSPTAAEVEAFVEFANGARIVRHGDCRGLDRTISGHVVEWNRRARGAGGPETIVEAWPAQWERYGALAGPRRNREMLLGGETGPRADVLVAFPGNRGTANCTAIAKGLNIHVILIGELVTTFAKISAEIGDISADLGEKPLGGST